MKDKLKHLVKQKDQLFSAMIDILRQVLVAEDEKLIARLWSKYQLAAKVFFDNEQAIKDLFQGHPARKAKFYRFNQARYAAKAKDWQVLSFSLIEKWQAQNSSLVKELGDLNIIKRYGSIKQLRY